ncbi:hypothetical protein D3C76_471430 [compost metagenome]
MQGVHAGVAPVAVEVVFGQGGLATAQFEQGGACREGNLGADGTGLGHRDGSGGHVVGSTVVTGAVQVFAGALEQGFCGVQADRQVAETLQRQRVIAGLVQAGVDPGAAAGAHEVQGIFIGGAGDAGVDGGMEDLRQRADRGGALEGALERHHVGGADVHVVEHHRAAAGGALAEAAPVVDHLQALAVGRDEDQVLHALFIDHRGGNALGVDGAGGVELAAVDAKAIAVAGQASGALVGGLGAQFGQGIAKAAAGQYFGVQALLLFGCAVYPQHFQAVEMVLRDLPERAVGLGDADDDLGQGDVGHAGAAEGLGHADGPQAGAGEQFQFGVRQAALAVAQGAVAAQVSGDFFGDVQGFGVVGDDVCSHGVSPGPWGRFAAHRDTRPLLQEVRDPL